MTGSVHQINVSRGGLPKHAITEGRLEALGLDGDGHAHPNIHGGPRQAVLLISSEGIEELAALGFPLYPGALGENITTRGLDHRQWRLGQRWRIGRDAVVEFKKIRSPCNTILVYGTGIHLAVYDALVKAGDPSSPKWGLSGFYASVIEPGLIRTGDPIVACPE